MSRGFYVLFVSSAILGGCSLSPNGDPISTQSPASVQLRSTVRPSGIPSKELEARRSFLRAELAAIKENIPVATEASKATLLERQKNLMRVADTLSESSFSPVSNPTLGDVQSLQEEQLWPINPSPQLTYTHAYIDGAKVAVSTFISAPIPQAIGSATSAAIVENSTNATYPLVFTMSTPAVDFWLIGVSGNLAPGFTCKYYGGTMTATTEYSTGIGIFNVNWQMDSHTTHAAPSSCNAYPLVPVNLSADSIRVGSTAQATMASQACLTPTWISQSPGVATVSSSGVVTGVAPGTAVVTYSCLLAQVREGTRTMTVLPPCVPQDSGGVSEIRVHREHVGSSLVEPCGENTPPGTGGGGPPTYNPDPENCRYSRDFVIYDDGSWEWLTAGWYLDCGDPMLQGHTSPPSTDSGASEAQSAQLVRLRLIDRGRLSGGLGAIVAKDVSSDYDVLIAIDRLSARSEDIERALVRAAEAPRVHARDTRTRLVGSVVSNERTLFPRTGTVRAREVLKELELSDVSRTSLLGAGKSLDLVLDRRTGDITVVRPR